MEKIENCAGNWINLRKCQNKIHCLSLETKALNKKKTKFSVWKIKFFN